MIKKRLVVPACILFFIAIFFLLYENNNTYIHFQLKTDQHGPGQVYFKNANEDFNESQSVVFKIKAINQWNNYKIKIPSNYFNGDFRIDPIRSEGNIYLDNITITKQFFFKKTEIQLDSEDSLTFTNQLVGLRADSKSFSARSIGDDPYFQFSAFKSDKSEKLYWYGKELFIFFGMLFLVFLIYKIFRKQSSNDISKIIIYGLVFLIFLGKMLFYSVSVPYGDTPDEQMHLSYVAHLKKYDTFIPKYDRFYAFNNDGTETEQVIHLEHPSIYYHLLSFFMEDSPDSVMKSYDTARGINIIISSISILLLLYLGFIHKFSLIGHMLYAVALTSVPMLGFVGAGINNDNLCLLGGALTLIGCKRILDNFPKIDKSSFFITSLGFSVSVLTKLNTGLVSGLVILFTFAYLLYKSKNLTVLLSKEFLISSPIYLFPIIYYFLLFHGYGLIQPSLQNIAPDYFFKTDFYVPESERIYLSMIEYISHFFTYIWKTWSEIASHIWVQKQNLLQAIALFLLPIIAVLALFIKPKDKSFLLARIGLLSLFILMMIHFINVYNSYLTRGYLGGIQARYYFSIIASIFLLSSEFTDRIKNENLRLLIVAPLIISLLYSDFYYFLINNPYN